MKKYNSILSLIVVLTAGLLVSSPAGAESADGYALLVQQSPPDAGSINPGEGVHKMPVGQKVTLSATPKPGYRFLYWLGDVSKVSSNDTSIEIDSPKMVVAVYARDDYEDMPVAGAMGNAGGGAGGGGTGASNVSRYIGSPISAAASVSPATASYSAPTYTYTVDYSDYTDYSNQTEEDSQEPTDGVPIPTVPEPTTVALLGLGGLAVLRRRRK